MKKGLFIAGCFFTAVLLFFVSMTLVLLLAFIDRQKPLPVPVVLEPEPEITEDLILETVGENPRLAFDYFRKLLLASPDAYNECHGFAHQLGHEAYEQFGFEGALNYSDALCGGGFVHGVLEARFGEESVSSIISELPTICTEENTACFHGIGHGLMIVTYLDTDASLRYCDRLPDVGRSDCYDGVWMHIFDLEESGARDLPDYSTVIDPAHVAKSAKRCADADSAYKTNCYFYLPRILAHNALVSFEHYTDLCTSVDEEYRLTCSVGSGHAIMKYAIENPNSAVEQCLGYDQKELVGGCKEGAFIYYLFAGGLSSISDAPTTGYQEKCDVFIEQSDRRLCDRVDGYRGEI